MEFTEVTLPSVGVRGIVPQGWMSIGNGQYIQRSERGFCTQWQRAHCLSPRPDASVDST